MIYSMQQKLIEFTEQVESAYTNYSHTTSYENPIKSGINELYKEVSMLPGGYSLIASKNVHESTSLALAFASQAALHKDQSVLIVDTITHSVGIILRLVAQAANIPIQTLQSGELVDGDWSKLTCALGIMNDAPVYIHDTASVSIDALIQEIELLNNKAPLDLIVVTGLDNIGSTNQQGDSCRHASCIARLDRLAGDLNLAILATTQFIQYSHGASDEISTMHGAPNDLWKAKYLIMMPPGDDQNSTLSIQDKSLNIIVYKFGSLTLTPSIVSVSFNVDTGKLS